MKILIANWKMNLGVSAAAKLATELTSFSKKQNQAEVWIAPAFTSIAALQPIIANSKIKLGAQNVHWEKSGAFTGEVSYEMLAELGVTFALVGHSERRHVLGESDQLVNKRGLGAIPYLKIVFCVGETLAEREAGEAEKAIDRQLRGFLSDLKPDLTKNLLFAYEPVWAIGSGKVASVKEIITTHTFIDSLWRRLKPNLPTPPILYGGSVTPENFGEILKVPLVAGGLIGGASLDFEKFKKLIEIVS